MIPRLGNRHAPGRSRGQPCPPGTRSASRRRRHAGRPAPGATPVVRGAARGRVTARAAGCTGTERGSSSRGPCSASRYAGRPPRAAGPSRAGTAFPGTRTARRRTTGTADAGPGTPRRPHRRAHLSCLLHPSPAPAPRVGPPGVPCRHGLSPRTLVGLRPPGLPFAESPGEKGRLRLGRLRAAAWRVPARRSAGAAAGRPNRTPRAAAAAPRAAAPFPAGVGHQLAFDRLKMHSQHVEAIPAVQPDAGRPPAVSRPGAGAATRPLAGGRRRCGPRTKPQRWP